MRQSDLVARLGGDEFVVLIEEHRGPEEVMIVAQKILAFLERPVLLEWREVKISGSVGIASFPDDGEDLETLVKNADAAMYQAKERGRNNFQFYSAELNRISLERAQLEKRVRGALENDEFFLQYQPEVELATGHAEGGGGAAALARSGDRRRDARGLPAARRGERQHHRDRPVGAGARARRPQGVAGAGPGPHALAQRLRAPAAAPRSRGRDRRRRCRPTAIAAAKLRLEIAEPALMQESDATDRTMRALQALGVEIAIDNFGTGYSSLGLVRGFSVQAVKIDKSLVSSCPNKRECAAIVGAVGAMAKNLGLTVIASGVETEEEKKLVASLGCDRAQGLLIGRAVDWAQIAALAGIKTPVPAE